MLTTSARRFFSIQSRLTKFQPPAPTAIAKKQEQQKHFPIQHPAKIDSPNSSILNRDKPVEYIQPRFETPFEIYHPSDYGLQTIDQPASPRTLEVALIGAPNAGKSSLMNAILSSQISAVSNKSNTTYESIMGVHTNIAKSTQILMYDTPGITKQSRMSKNYVTRAWEILNDVEKALFVVDGVKTLDDKVREALRRLNTLPYNDASEKKIAMLTNLDKNDPLYSEKMSLALQMDTSKKLSDQQTFPKVLVLNKIDLCTNRKKLNWLVQELEDLSKFDHKFFVSSTTGYGIPALVEYLESEALPAPWQMHSQVKSGLSKIEIIEQIMKSAIFSRFFEELPYQIGVSLKEYAARSDGVVKLHFELDVDSIPQKKIVTGHQGRNVKELISLCQMEFAKAFEREMEITVQIRVRKESLERSNQQVEDITPDTYSEQKAKSILTDAQTRRKQLAAELESVLPYPKQKS